MNAIPKHLLGGIIAFVVLAAAGGGAWFWTGSRLAAAVEERSSLQQQIATIGSKGIFPSSANLKILKDNVEAAGKIATDLLPRLEKQKDLLAPFTAEGKGMAPDAWKQKLFERREALMKLAESRKVAVTDDFYFGFKRYRVASPRPETTRDLGIQLAAIDELSRLLIEARVQSLTEVRRVMVDDAGSTGPVSAAGDEGLAALVVEGGGGLYRVFPFELRFAASPAALREFVNALARSGNFFITRFIVVENQKNVVPKRSEITGQGAAPANLGGLPGGPGAAESRLLIPVLGQEALNVRARIDCIVWSTPDAAPAKAPAPAKP